MREIARNLARLGARRVKKGDELNVRRRESVRRALIEAGEELGWARVAALREDPVDVAAKDVKKIMRRGVRSLKRGVTEEMAKKEAEGKKLEKVLATVQSLAENPNGEYPAEITYTRTAKSPVQGLVTKTETLELSDAEEAARAAKKMQKSLPRWAKHREQMLENMERRRENLGQVSRDISDLVDSWRGLLREVLFTMR